MLKKLLTFIQHNRFLRRLDQALKERDKTQLVNSINDESDDATDSPQASSPLLVQKQKETQSRFSRQKKVSNLKLEGSDRNKSFCFKNYLSD